MYEFDEKTGEGRIAPNNPLEGLSRDIEKVLNVYIGPRHKIATDKIAEEIEIVVLEFLDRLHNNNIYPPIKLPEIPSDWGE